MCTGHFLELHICIGHFLEPDICIGYFLKPHICIRYFIEPTYIYIYALHTFSSSSSGAVFFEKVGCHDPPWLPILSNSHEVLVSHSRPVCDVCQPLRSWPSSAQFPLHWTLQKQPVDVVMSDHVTNVGDFFFSLLLELYKAVRLPVLGLLHLFSYPSRIFSSSSDMPTFQTIEIVSYF